MEKREKKFNIATNLFIAMFIGIMSLIYFVAGSPIIQIGGGWFYNKTQLFPNEVQAIFVTAMVGMIIWPWFSKRLKTVM